MFEKVSEVLSRPEYDRGFLPENDPTCYVQGTDDLNEVLVYLPYHFKSGKIRELANKLPRLWESLDFNSLSTGELRSLRRDYGFLAAAYHFARDREKSNYLPDTIAIPLYRLSQLLGVQRPTLSYFSYALDNWWRPNPNLPIQLDNLRTLRHFVYTMDEEWFIICLLYTSPSPRD